MASKLSRFINPPEFENTEQRLLGRLLHIITLSLIALSISSLFITIFISGNVRVTILASIMLVLCLVLNRVVRRGHIRVAGTALTIGSWLIITTTFLVYRASKGVYDPAFNLYVIPILIGGFVLGGRAGMGVALVSVVTGFAILVEQIGRGGERFTVPELMLQWTMQSMIFVVSALLVGLGYRIVQEALARANRSENRLTEQNKALQAEIAQRQSVADALRQHQARIGEAMQVAGMDTWNWDIASNAITYPDRTPESSQIFAHTFEEFISRVHPNDQPTVRKDVDISLTKGTAWTRECRYLHPTNGQYQWIYITAKVYYGEGGKPAGLAGVSVDINHRKQAEERFYKAFHANPTAIAISRVEDGIIIDVNKAWMEILGNNRDAWVGRNSYQLDVWDITPEQDADYQRAMSAIGYVHNLEVMARNDQGALVPVLARVETIELDGKPHRIVMLQDLRERKRAEQHALELALEKERVAFLTDFMGNISHDLKTPLTVINTSLYLLERTADTEKRQERLETIREQGRLLEKFIHDILTISRLDAAPGLEFKPVDTNRLLRDIEGRLRSSIESKRLTVTLNLDDSLKPIEADEDELARLLVNLVENAVNYTPSGGSVRVNTRRDDGRVVIEVVDTGMGIEPDNIPNIFNRFYRTDTARAAHGGGTGLGLAIVKMVAEMHQGTVEVESASGEGSTFRVRLPISQNGTEKVWVESPVSE